MEVKSDHLNLNQFFIKLLPLLLILLASLFYFETLQSLYIRWVKWDESLSHGLIIIALFLYFLFIASPFNVKQESTLLKTLSLGCLGLSSLAWYLSQLINLQIIEQLSLLAIIIFLFVSIYGTHILKQHITLLLLPIFAIPVWDQLVDPLVNLSGFIVGHMVRLINLPAVIDGNSIFIPYGEVVIADGCSGLRYLTISLAIAYIISYLNGYTIKKFAIALTIAVLIGLFSNWVRIFILIMVGYQSKMQSSLMNEHEYFGWALFAVIVFPAIYFAPVVKKVIITKTTTAPKKITGAIVLLCLGPALAHFLQLPIDQAPITTRIPHEFHPIPARKMPIEMKLATTPTTSETAQTDTQVFVKIDHYLRRSSEEKLVPYFVRSYSNVSWSVADEKASKKFKISILRHKHNGTIVAQTQWFDIAGIRTNYYAAAKFLQIPAALRGGNYFSIFTLQIVCKNPNCNTEIDQLINAGQTLITPQ